MLLLRTLAAFVLVCASACAATADPGTRSLTVKDMLAVEGAGAAMADPSGRWVYFEQVRPYNQFTDYSFRTYAFEKTGHQVWRVDHRSGNAPELLPGLNQNPHTWLQDISPSGRFLSLIQYSFGDLSLVAYDTQQEMAVSFAPVPAFSRSGEHNPVWLSDDEIVYAALPEGLAPLATSMRAHTGKMLIDAWQGAWRGDVVTANEVRTRGPDVSDEAEDGSLIRADALSGNFRVMANGLFVDLRVSPGGAKLAALSVSKPRSYGPGERADTDPRRYKLVVFDLNSGEIKRLAQDLEIFPYSIAWSPDGRRLAAFGWKEGTGVQSGRFHVVDTQTGSVTRYDHRGLDLASERERGWLQRPERTVFLGDELAVFARKVLDSENEAARFTFREFQESGLESAGWFALSADGTSRNLTQGLSSVSGVPVHAGKGHFTVLADNGLFRFWEDGRREQLFGPSEGVLYQFQPGTFSTRSQVIRPDFKQEAIFYYAADQGRRIVMTRFEETSAARHMVIEVAGNDATPLAGSLEAGALLFRFEDGPASVLALAKPAERDSVVELARLNGHLSDIDLGEWKLISYPVDDPDGEVGPALVESCVLLPPGYNGRTPIPLVVDVYPDARPRCKNDAIRITYPNPLSPYIWAGRGFAYARLSTPSKLIRASDGPIAGIDEVIEAGVEALIRAGIADPERLVLTGFSQGGVSSLYVASKPNRFRAVIAMNSWADFASHYFGSSGILSHLYGLFGSFSSYEALAGSDFGIGRTPFEDPQAYIRNSPVFLAQDIHAPVLLVHTDMDTFPIYQFDEMYGALLRAGKDARYVRYWGEGHGLSSPANIEDLWSRIDAFLEDQGIAP
ncbi:MAG TPA: hypothetical protein DCY26_14250 [Hyphomonas sp.]|nr:hypothetical protein [Hyphomonas sp.]